MKTVAISEAEATLSVLIAHIDQEPLALEQDGRQVAFIVSPEEYDTIRAAKGREAILAMGAIHAGIRSRIRSGAFTEEELEHFAGSFDNEGM